MDQLSTVWSVNGGRMLLETSLRVLSLFLVVGFVSLMLVRRPRARLALWTTFLVSLLVFPALHYLMSALRVEVPRPAAWIGTESPQDDAENRPSPDHTDGTAIVTERHPTEQPTLVENASRPVDSLVNAPHPRNPVGNAVPLGEKDDASRSASSAVPSDINADPPPTQLPADRSKRLADWIGAHWLAVIAGVYLAGVTWLLLRLAIGLLVLARLRKRAAAVTEAAWVARTEAVRGEFRLARKPLLRAHKRVTSPAMSGFVRPVLFLPEHLLDAPDEEVEHVVRHELAHCRHFGPLGELLWRVAEAVYWPHPCVWLASRAWSDASEQYCDRIAVGDGQRLQGYVALLL